MPDPLPGIVVEGFGLPDNLMIPGAVSHLGGQEMVIPSDGQDRAFDALDIFERCVALAARSSIRTSDSRPPERIDLADGHPVAPCGIVMSGRGNDTSALATSYAAS